MLPSDRVFRPNSLSALSRVIAGVAGVGAAGALASVSPKLGPVFVVDAATFVASAGLVHLVRPGLVPFVTGDLGAAPA